MSKRKNSNIWKELKSELLSHKLIYLFLSLILAGGFIVRVYNIDATLGFYFDQGRDALVIWDLWKNGKFFLIGPTTGIAGIFRGPFYYYLIAPFYILGQGDPVWPSVFLSFTTVVAGGLLYYLGFKFQNRVAGLTAAIITSFSFHLVESSRWLSNPTPMMLLSVLLILMMWLASKGSKIAWPAISFIFGLSLFHFGSSGEIFYLPALIIFASWLYKKQGFGKRESSINKKTIILSVLLFLITMLPQIVFDIRHEGILRSGIREFVTEGEKSVLTPNLFFKQRFESYYNIFTNKIFDARSSRELVILSIVGVSFFLFFFKLSKSVGVKVLTLLLLSPIVGFLFFKGNYGNLYDYYFTGYYFVFVLLFAIVVGFLWRYWFGKIFVIYFFAIFLQSNISLLVPRYVDYSVGPHTIIMKNQLEAIDWIYKDANGQEFNIDYYVPPVIPHAYEYLTKWYGLKKYGYIPKDSQLNILYTLQEVDPSHPDRVEEWRSRQQGIGDIQESVKFGGILVERRKRI